MFIINRALGFGGTSGGGGTESTWDRTQGTNIGNMTVSGGLAAAFDGNISQDSSQAAAASAAAGYVGKTFGSGQFISAITARGCSNFGFSSASSAENVTIDIYGKQGSAPANSTDGTLIGSSGVFTDADNNTEVNVTSNNTGTAFDHGWARISSGANVFCGELTIKVLT